MKILHLIILTSLFFVSSCKNGSIDKNEIDFGKITPARNAEKTLVLEFNDEALSDDSAYIEIAFFDETGKIPVNINFSLKGNKSSTNSFKLKARDCKKPKEEIPIIISSNSVTEEKTYRGNVEVLSASADLQNFITYGNNLKKSPFLVNKSVIPWRIKYQVPMALWRKLVLFGLLLLLIVIFTWIFILRNKYYPKFNSGEIIIVNSKGFEENSIPLKGKTKLIIGTSRLDESFFSRLLGSNIHHVLASKNSSFEIQLIPFIRKKNVFAKLKNCSNADLKVSYNKLKDMPFGNELIFNDYRIKINNEFEFIYLNSKHEQDNF